MSCPNESVLKAGIDHSLGESERAELEAHLGTCDACRQRSVELDEQSGRVAASLAALEPAPQQAVDARIALARFRSSQPTPSFADRVLGLMPKPAWGGAVAALALVMALVVSPSARAWAQGFLARLRVEKVAVVSFDRSAFSKEGTQAVKLIADMVSDEVVIDKDPGEAKQLSSVEEASRTVGFHVRSLSGLNVEPTVKVHGEAAYRLTVNLDRLQAILEDAGRNDIALPRSLDGATVSLHLPAIVFNEYGTCPSFSKGARHDHGSEEAAFENCTVLIQAPSPTVTMPAELSIQKLVEAGLQLGGLSADAVKAFTENVDWTSTLVIPIPRDTSSSETVQVEGVSGTLVRTTQWGPRHPAHYQLIWVKNGIVHALIGVGDGHEAASLVQTLR